jgi:hypothetical protein
VIAKVNEALRVALETYLPDPYTRTVDPRGEANVIRFAGPYNDATKSIVPVLAENMADLVPSFVAWLQRLLIDGKWAFRAMGPPQVRTQSDLSLDTWKWVRTHVWLLRAVPA